MKREEIACVDQALAYEFMKPVIPEEEWAAFAVIDGHAARLLSYMVLPGTPGMENGCASGCNIVYYWIEKRNLQRKQIMTNTKENADVLLKSFWRDNDRFADLFNATVFHGNRVIQPEDLQELDTDMSGVIELGRDHTETIARTRDVIKKSAYGVDFVILGIESQKNIHYAMPLRSMIYDSLGYLKEQQDMTRRHRSASGNMNWSSGDEFLSGMKKSDRLHPIITVVIYYSEREWDGPVSLRDMMFDMPEEICNVFSDYRMNLVQVRDSDRFTFSNEDVETVFRISRSLFRGDIEEVRRCYGNRNIKSELAAVIGRITEAEGLLRQADGRQEVMNMCTALENLKEEGREEGREEGARLKKLEVVRNMLRLGMDYDIIQKTVGVSGEEIRGIEEELNQ